MKDNFTLYIIPSCYFKNSLSIDYNPLLKSSNFILLMFSILIAIILTQVFSISYPECWKQLPAAFSNTTAVSYNLWI